MRTLLILIALVVIVVMAKRLWLDSRADKKPRQRLAGKMVQCSYCGVYVPEEEAVRDGDRSYCSKEHRHADKPED